MGKRCQLILGNRQDALGRTWSNITTILPPPKDEPEPERKRLDFGDAPNLYEEIRTEVSEVARRMRERFAAQREANHAASH